MRFPARSSTAVISWKGTWRSTYLGLSDTQIPQIQCKNLFSDVLHRPFVCVHTSLLSFTSNVPPHNTIPRFTNLSAEEFSTCWTNQPFILTDPVREWPVFKKWSRKHLVENYGKLVFRAEAVDWPLKTYMEYMDNNQDESPLYLFDRSFVEKINLVAGESSVGSFWIPECFGEDLFAVLGDQRPDYRWLIIGPKRSGSTFHKDPNGTRSVINTKRVQKSKHLQSE